MTIYDVSMNALKIGANGIRLGEVAVTKSLIEKQMFKLSKNVK